jgi:hypothetical protein
MQSWIIVDYPQMSIALIDKILIQHGGLNPEWLSDSKFTIRNCKDVGSSGSIAARPIAMPIGSNLNWRRESESSSNSGLCGASMENSFVILQPDFPGRFSLE